LNEWNLEVQARRGNGLTLGFAKLSDDGLLGFVNGVSTVQNNKQYQDSDQTRERGKSFLHDG
jgi:hypothetical protein